MKAPPLNNIHEVLSEYHAPWCITGVIGVQSDLTRQTLGYWIRRLGHVLDIDPDGGCTLSVRVEDTSGNQILAPAYKGTEEQCKEMASRLINMRVL